MRTIALAALAMIAACASESPTRWDLDLIEVSRSGDGCSDSAPLTLRMGIDDPMGDPNVIGDAPWTCRTEDDSVICTRQLGVDIGAVTMTAREDSATLDMAGVCTFEFLPR